jgi:hypothetical protein
VVLKYSPAGNLLMALGTWDKPLETGWSGRCQDPVKQAAGPFHRPTDVAVSPTGDVYISDGYGTPGCIASALAAVYRSRGEHQARLRRASAARGLGAYRWPRICGGPGEQPDPNLFPRRRLPEPMDGSRPPMRHLCRCGRGRVCPRTGRPHHPLYDRWAGHRPVDESDRDRKVDGGHAVWVDSHGDMSTPN